MFDLRTRVLVVDDMLTMRKLISDVCREIGFTDITEAADGALAWSAITKAQPSIGLIISDLVMPNSSGIDLLKRVRGDAKHRNLPFIMATAEADHEQILEAVKAGVSSYLIKPFDAELLKAKLQLVYSKIHG